MALLAEPSKGTRSSQCQPAAAGFCTRIPATGRTTGTLKVIHCGKRRPDLPRSRSRGVRADSVGLSRGAEWVRTLPGGIGAGLPGQSLHEGAGQQRGRQGAPAQLAQPEARAARQVQIRLVDARALDGGEARQHPHHLRAGLPVPAGRRARLRRRPAPPGRPAPPPPPPAPALTG